MKDTIKRIFDVLFYESEIISKTVSPIENEKKSERLIEDLQNKDKKKEEENVKKIIYLIYFLLIIIFIILCLLLF